MKPPPPSSPPNTSNLILPLLLGISIPLLVILYTTLFIREYHQLRLKSLNNNNNNTTTLCKCYYCRIRRYANSIFLSQSGGYIRKPNWDRFNATLRGNSNNNTSNNDGFSNIPQNPYTMQFMDGTVSTPLEDIDVESGNTAVVVDAPQQPARVFEMGRVRRWSTSGTDTTVTSLPPYTEFSAEYDGGCDGGDIELDDLDRRGREKMEGSLRRMPTSMRSMQRGIGSSSVGRSLGKRWGM